MHAAPEFWNHRAGPGSAPLRRTLLTPVSWLYQSGAALRAATTRAYRAEAPVVCVGNVTVGGAGKTPVTMAILERLAARGVEAHALSRGYGGRKTGPLEVDPARHTYRDVGDEPLLLARKARTWVAKSKPGGARAAVAAGAKAIVMDDGFQNPTIAKDLSLVLIDAASGLGNGRVVPAGPLRESARSALSRADAVVLVSAGPEPDKRAAWRNYVPAKAPILEVDILPEGAGPGSDIYAFAGIARPEKFFDSLVRWGAEVVATMSFPDHHPYSDEDMKLLRDAARRHNAVLMTTEKDHTRLPPKTRRLVHAWPVTAKFRDLAALDALLDKALDSAARR